MNSTLDKPQGILSFNLFICAFLLLFLIPSGNAWAQQGEQAGQSSGAEDVDAVTMGQTGNTKSGFRGRPGLGGPTSVGAQLEEDDEVKEPAIRIPAIDKFFQPWFDWKRRLNENYGLQLGLDYNALYQGASETLPNKEDKAASGALRFFGRWTLVNRETKNTGTLVFKVENRHRLGTDIPPSQLGFDVGYNGITGTLFSDVGTVLVDLNWQQFFNDGNGGFIVGRYDPNDYMDVLGYSNPWTTFSNLSILVNTTIALPDSSFGVGAAHAFKDQWIIRGAINDANGVIDDVSVFEDGAEFFTFAQLDWGPTIKERYFKNVHVTLWHVDERESAAIPSSQGVALGANWTFYEKFMPFVRAGWSDGTAPLMNKTATVGFIQRIHLRDLVGLGFNWGDPSNKALRDQYSTELFYRFQFSQNFAITPSVQLLIDPALNPTEDKIWVFGIRARLSL
jgi:porin